MANSVVGSVITKWSSLAFSGKPAKLWFDGVPLRDGAVTVDLPTVELVDNGTAPEYDFEYNPIETTEITFVVRATTLAEADSIAAGIRYNGGAVNAGLGYDFGTLTITGQRVMKIERTREQRSRETSDRGPEALPIHRIDLDYSVQTVRSA